MVPTSTSSSPHHKRASHYFASLGTSTKAHTFVISIDTPNAETFSAVIPTTEKIIDSVRLPATVSEPRSGHVSGRIKRLEPV